MKYQKRKKAVRENKEANKLIRIVVYLFLMVATLFVYGQIQDHEFITHYDDQIYVTDNVNVKAGLTRESIKWAFTTVHFFNWHPFTWLSHMLDFQLYGLHPKGHLVTNLFFHISNALLLFTLFFRMTGALWQSSFVAIMFALHPLNVESVAWVAERKNVLSTFFWLLTMWAYIFYVNKPSARRYCWMVIFFAFGLMSKPMLVTLPFILLLIDCWPLKRINIWQDKEDVNHRTDIFRVIFEKIPLFLFAAISSIVTFFGHKSGGALQAMETISLSRRLNNALVSYIEYLEKTFWPKGLAVFYPHHQSDFMLWKGILCGIVLVSISIISIKLIRKAPYFAAGWFWYLGTLVPVIQIIQTGRHAMADRYAYIPIIGIFIILAWGLPELLARWRHKEKILTVFVIILIPTLMTISWNQVGYWKDSETLFKHTIHVTEKVDPDLALIHNNLGIVLENEGRISEATDQYRAALKINPDFALPLNNLGNIMISVQETEQAIKYYQSALKINPEYAMAHNNLGIAFEKKGKFEEATSHYREAVRLQPELVLAHYNLGSILKEKRKFEEAISHYRLAIKFKPNFALAHNNLGNILLAIQENEQAIIHYRQAIRIDPNLIMAHNNLKIALLRSQ